MKKKLYEKPAMNIVKLQQQAALLDASAASAAVLMLSDITVESATWGAEENL